jgi:hypothetical protein
LYFEAQFRSYSSAYMVESKGVASNILDTVIIT